MTRTLSRVPRFVLVTALLLSLLVVACGDGSESQGHDDGIKVEVANGALPALQAPQVLVAPTVQPQGIEPAGATTPLTTFAPLPANGTAPAQPAQAFTDAGKP